MGWMKKVRKAGKRKAACILAIFLTVVGIGIPMPSQGSEIWPQKSTAPFYCIDGGKGWKSTDRYEIYKYDTVPSPITEIQARRLFWAYPSNWQALKEAAKKYDAELYGIISGVGSDPNVVKRVKDDPGTKFAWVADHPEIEQRAILALEKAAAENSSKGKEAPEAIRAATSEEQAVSFTVLPFSAGPGALDTEFQLGSTFIKDIAKIEAQSVWDNGSDGGNVGWLDASQDKNIAKSVLGESLYEITWGGDSIKIRNNGSVTANENVVGGTMSEEQKYNKTTVRYKITMRENSGWYTDGSWSSDYLREWMDFKACVNAAGHQRLYKADIRIVPSDMVFYLVISQGDTGETYPAPEYGSPSSDYGFQVYRHEEKLQASYNVKLKKIDDETEKPLKGSQFYLYERFEDEDLLGDERDGGLSKENLSFEPWDGFQIFSEGTTDEDGEICHTDVRSYRYSKTYCDGHGMPDWVSVPEEEESEEGEEDDADDSEAEAARDQNRAAARAWMELYHGCEAEAGNSDTHFHWLMDDSVYDVVSDALDSGEPGDFGGGTGADAETAFVRSGCKADCEKTYDALIHLRFSYTWKEIQARNGYILHDIHEKDVPVEIITTSSSEAGADAFLSAGNSREIAENNWYSGNREHRQKEFSGNKTAFRKERSWTGWNTESVSDAEAAGRKDMWSLKAIGNWLRIVFHADQYRDAGSNASESDAWNSTETGSDADFIYEIRQEEVAAYSYDDSDWEESENEDFSSYQQAAKIDGITHLKKTDSGIDSYPEEFGQDCWIVKNHRTEGKIDINKRDMDLYRGESDEYSSLGDTEGDSVLEGAVYGLFAAEDIVHPDSDVQADGSMTNTGVVYKKNDLVSVAVTDAEGNARFSSYTAAPGMTYDYEIQKIGKRKDIDWNGPENRYKENYIQNGNWWIGRPLILGSYYVKELSRSTGYELSVNGKSKEWSNYGAETKTPDSITRSNGTTVIALPELAASMEGEDASGNGYDQLTFTVTSSGTTNAESKSDGYELFMTGFPKNTKFYRVDSGERMVTGPHVVGTEEHIVKDEMGNIVWKTAESDTSNVCYEPEYDETGKLIGQNVVRHVEPQILTAVQVPQAPRMKLDRLEVMLEEEILNETLTDESFYFLKAEVERILNQNGYEIPVNYDGACSSPEMPIYSMGVKKGEPDIYGMTTEAGTPALRTVYGMAVQTIVIEDADRNTKISEFLQSILSWYKENPQWSFGGIHKIQWTDLGCEISLYAGASISGSRRFFTMKQENGKEIADKVYSVIENPVTCRWEYQEYQDRGSFRYEILKQYSFGSGTQKRYYIDVTLMPAVLVNQSGQIEVIEHTVMDYHKQGEEIIDYLNGDPKNGYRVPLTEYKDKIEITTEPENAEEDVQLQDVIYDKKTGVYKIKVQSCGTDAFGQEFSDENQSLTLTFMVKLPEKKAVITNADIEYMGAGNVYGYQAGDEIGLAEYLMRFQEASISAAAGADKELGDTYIVQKRLVYRGQNRVTEDGDTAKVPVQVLQRPIKQKVKIIKETENGQAVKNFRFKIYLKSNLERLYCDQEGNIIWLDKDEKEVDIFEYKKKFPELVQKIYTQKTDRRVLEEENYEKFFDAVWTANTDVWRNEGTIQNTSWKPTAKGKFTGIENTINTSWEAKENAKRSDAVRQFAVTWYLEDEGKEYMAELPDADEYQAKKESVDYPDEIYDQALYQAILKAETYLAPFFKYDLDSVYAVLWDSEKDGGLDGDMSTLAANQAEKDDGASEYAYGISKYLPYGKYVLAEQQPYRAEWMDFENRHYRIDTPKEIELPYYDADGEGKPYDQMEWSVTEPGSKTEMTGYVLPVFLNKDYKVKLRIEKLDAETGEPILHEDSVFALYRAERNQDKDGDGAVKRYDTDTVIVGSREFLQAMGAERITPLARNVGRTYFGLVKAGTPICSEEDAILFYDHDGKITGQVLGVSTIKDCSHKEIFQTVGYAETPEPVEAGVYVLAELKPPSGYVRSSPTAIEIYSDAVRYYLNGGTEKAAAVKFQDENSETARIYVNNTATSLEISKLKTADRYRGMKVSGRVEGTISELKSIYGLENLELAYNSMGTYQGFGWKKGTLDLLEERKAQGERLEIVYENGIFQGYGYVTRTLETSYDENPYVTGSKLALYDAIAVRNRGDSGDYAFEGVNVIRDQNSNVTEITVKEGFAGEKTEFVCTADGIWTAETIERKETPVLFYDLGNLKVTERGDDGTLYGYDKNCGKIKIHADTESIFAIRGGRAVFEIVSQDFSSLIYSKKNKAFIKCAEGTVIYHLDENLCRDSQVDGYTGLAYVEKEEKNPQGKYETYFYLWPVTEIRNSEGALISKEKILTGRTGEKNEGTENAYLDGTWNSETENFEKSMNPIYNRFGMIQFYPHSEAFYKKGQILYDRDGDVLGYRYDDLLELYNRAAYQLFDHEILYTDERSGDSGKILKKRQGEAWIIPNIWISGEKLLQDPETEEMSTGQADILRRVIPGTYIMEEVEAAKGYVRALPIAVNVDETEKVQRVSMTDEKTKIEILKVDGTAQYKNSVVTDGRQSENEWYTEGKNAYTGKYVAGAKLALYKAKRIYVSDYEKYPKGYYLAKAESTPAVWTVENPVDNSPIEIEAVWITENGPKYFEGIPAGDYLLEELESVSGYLPSTMEITVKETKELQSFFLLEDHTKTEIVKYETDKKGKKRLLPKGSEAELTLYPAVLDSNGEPVVREGKIQYEENQPIDQWKTADASEETEAIKAAYEAMFAVYGNSFDQFSWEIFEDHAMRTKFAKLEESHSTANGEGIVQIWQKDDGTQIYITASRNDGTAGIDALGRPEILFTYGFHFKKGENSGISGFIRYDTENGIHRLERLPVGVYILVETKTPDGYLTAEPQVIYVRETGSVQRFTMENEKANEQIPRGQLLIEKVDAENIENKLSGAWFEVENLSTGKCFRKGTDESGTVVFRDLPAEGPDRDGKWEKYVYKVKEVTAPPGYQIERTEKIFKFNGTEEESLTYRITVKNQETKVRFQKTDLVTGEELPGAKLTLRDKKGDVLDQWISGKMTHEIAGKLIAGETYILSEEEAPDGYLVAEDIEFTVPEDGPGILVVMKDARKEQTEEQEPPKEPEIPKEPNQSEIPKEPDHPKPDRPPENIPTEKPLIKYGRITAEYQLSPLWNRVIYLDEIKNGYHDQKIMVPKTGDDTPVELMCVLLFASLVGMIMLCAAKGKKENEE